MIENEDLCENKGSDGFKYDEINEDLPRIVIESFRDSSGKLEDRIVVLEEESVKSNESSWEADDVEGDSDFLEEEASFSVDDVVSDGEKLSMALEDVLGEVLNEDEGGSNEDFYKVGGDIGEKYNSVLYSEVSDLEEKPAVGYERIVDLSEIKSFSDIEEERKRGRSILEAAGFRDEEAERKRKAKQDFSRQ